MANKYVQQIKRELSSLKQEEKEEKNDQSFDFSTPETRERYELLRAQLKEVEAKIEALKGEARVLLKEYVKKQYPFEKGEKLLIKKTNGVEEPVVFDGVDLPYDFFIGIPPIPRLIKYKKDGTLSKGQLVCFKWVNPIKVKLEPFEKRELTP